MLLLREGWSLPFRRRGSVSSRSGGAYFALAASFRGLCWRCHGRRGGDDGDLGRELCCGLCRRRTGRRSLWGDRCCRRIFRILGLGLGHVLGAGVVVEGFGSLTECLGVFVVLACSKGTVRRCGGAVGVVGVAPLEKI